MVHLTAKTPVRFWTASDIIEGVHSVLRESSEPLTPAKIRGLLPRGLRFMSLPELGDLIERQVAARVLRRFPRYRSQHERFWDRPMEVHLARLIRNVLADGPLSWPELRRRLPPYARIQAEAVLHEQLANGELFRLPPSGRAGARFGILPPDPREYLRPELIGVFRRLQAMGFAWSQLLSAALELLHEEAWECPIAEAR